EPAHAGLPAPRAVFFWGAPRFRGPARGRATALGPILPVGELEEAWARLEERRQTPAPWSSSRPRRVAPGRSTRCCAGPGERDAGVGAREPLPPESVAAARRPDE
ncbi:unnamed protein product, partial [Prorocentrum cordatum]